MGLMQIKHFGWVVLVVLCLHSLCATSKPQTQQDVQAAVSYYASLVQKTTSLECSPASPSSAWLRTAYHDALTYFQGTGGADGSILFELPAYPEVNANIYPPAQ
jgi:hypothetical protein